MESLLRLPGAAVVSPFCYHNEQRQPARCDLVVHPGFGWAIATTRTDNPGGDVAQHLAALAQVVCNSYQLDPTRMVLLVRYLYAGGEHYYSTHFKHHQRDFFGQWSFVEGSRVRIHPADVEGALQMLAEGNEHVSVLRITQPVVPTFLPRKRTETSG